MTLSQRLEDDVKQAMLARDEGRRDALRLILAELRSAEKELQQTVDKYVHQVDELVKHKEAELLEV